MRPLALFLLLFLANRDSRAAGGPEFEVASLKPNTSPGSRVWLAPPVGDTFTATNVTPVMLISTAWSGFQTSGGPAWLNSDRYDVTAKMPDANPDRLGLMLQALLEDRFKLQTHRETKDIPGYALVIAKTGLKLPNANPAPCATFGLKKAPGQPDGCDAMSAGPGFIYDRRLSMSWLAGVISNALGRPVIDQTGYTGSFEVHLEFAPLQGDGGTDPTKPSLFTALQQMGLKLESQKVPIQILVIDHAEKPTEN